jgi:hypothetical protein
MSSVNPVVPNYNDYLNAIPVSRKTLNAAVGNPYGDIYQTVHATKANIVSYPEEPARMDVEFILESQNPYAAFAYANQPDLMEFGAKLCRGDGLSDVCLSERGIPIACDLTGKPLLDLQDNLEIDPKAEAGKLYYYSVTYKYLGNE